MMADEPKPHMLAPTRKLIILALSLVAALCIVVVAVLAVYGVAIPESLTTIAATAVGGVATMAAAAAQTGDD